MYPYIKTDKVHSIVPPFPTTRVSVKCPINIGNYFSKYLFDVVEMSAVTNLIVSNVTETMIQLQWTNSTSDTTVYAVICNSTSHSKAAQFSALQAQITGLMPAELYNCSVIATKALYPSSDSVTVQVQTGRDTALTV